MSAETPQAEFRRRRVARGTQVAVADAMGVSRRCVQDLEAGINPVKQRHLTLLSAVEKKWRRKKKE